LADGRQSQRMTHILYCSCGQLVHVDDQEDGGQSECPGCGAVVKAPASRVAKTVDWRSTEGLAASPRVPSGAGWEGKAGADERNHPSTPKLIAADTNPSLREYLYWGLLLALIPLGLLTLRDRKDVSVRDRLTATMREAQPEVKQRVERLLKTKGKQTELDDILTLLPGGKLDTQAHLPRETTWHWFYAAAAAIGFWALLLLLFPREPEAPWRLLGVGLFTGTVGILLLLAVQFVADASPGVWVRPGGLPLMVVYALVLFIGWSYSSAMNPKSAFIPSFVGFTCGVGLCEEVCKALPLILYFRHASDMGWRRACLWGLASGAGFGVSEGIMYSSSYYNGIAPLESYVVRFVSCVALHAMWSGAVGVLVWKLQKTIRGNIGWGRYGLAVLRLVAVPMVLHGLYDTILKKDLDELALIVGLLSFGWFAWQIEGAREFEQKGPVPTIVLPAAM
jgi:RsiW-degrading membrane proteinase PrsW (M82 family)